jgi:hypothetical protein
LVALASEGPEVEVVATVVADMEVGDTAVDTEAEATEVEVVAMEAVGTEVEVVATVVADTEVGDMAVDTEAEAMEVADMEATEVEDTSVAYMEVGDTEVEDMEVEATEVDTEAVATEVVAMVVITEVVMVEIGSDLAITGVEDIKDTDIGAAVMAVAMVVMVAEVTGDKFHSGGPRCIYFHLTMLRIL